MPQEQREGEPREGWEESEGELFRLMVEHVQDYAIFVIDREGRVRSWNPGAARLLGYRAEEIIGQSADVLFTPEDVERGTPQQEMQAAESTGRGQDDRWHVRKDGSRIWTSGMMTPLRDEDGNLRGFAKIIRDRTEWKLREEREQLQNRLIDTVGQAVIATRPDGIIFYWNHFAETLYGWSKSEAVGRNVSEVTVPQSQSANADSIMSRIAAGESWSGEFLVRRRDGTLFPAQVTNTPILDEDGKVSAIVGVSSDISERKQAEDILRHSEERFRTLMEQAPFSIQMFSPDGRTIRVNRAWEELWGVQFEQIERYNVLEDQQLEARGILPYIRRGFSGETARIPAIQYNPNATIPGITEHEEPDRWLSAVIYPLKDANGEIREVVLIHEDITARKRAEEALWQSRERLDLALQAADLGQWELNLVDRSAHRNLRHDQIFGYESLLPEWTYDKFIEHVVPEDRAGVDATFQQAMNSAEPWDFECRIRRADGALRWIWARGRAYSDDEGRTLRIVGTVADITERKRLERELQVRVEQLADVDRRKDEFLATLAHELRNPLAPIRNSLQVLKMARVDADTSQQIREMMERQVDHLVRLVDDLLDISRVMRGKIELRKEQIELASVIARAVETAKPLIDMQDHTLDISLPPESLLLHADPVRLAQVVGNLLTNAAKYTEASGHIRLKAERVGDEAILRVQDNGIGIAPDLLPHIFELFVQADHASTKAQGGLGIGLTLVKNLVEMHRGTVEACSEGLGKGCEFRVCLPLVAQKSQETIASGGRKQRPQRVSSGYRLLVVDDNEDAAKSLAILLRLQGHEVEVAHNGPSALELADSFHPHVIFLDIGMPKMDGYEVARRLRQKPDREGTILAALTGWGQQEDRRRTMEAGFDHHLVKPPDPKALEDVLAVLRRQK